jgi:hypothetical protein
MSVTKKKDLKQRKKAKPIFTKNYIFANSINFFFMEILKKRCGQKKRMDEQQTPFINNVKK